MSEHRGFPLGKQKNAGPARGVKVGSYTQMNLKLEHETFEQIRQKALRDNTSFAEAARTLLEWGLEAEEAA